MIEIIIFSVFSLYFGINYRANGIEQLSKSKDYLSMITGLPVSFYFSFLLINKLDYNLVFMLVLPLLGILFRHYILKLANSYFNEIDMKDMRKKLKELSEKEYKKAVNLLSMYSKENKTIFIPKDVFSDIFNKAQSQN